MTEAISSGFAVRLRMWMSPISGCRSASTRVKPHFLMIERALPSVQTVPGETALTRISSQPGKGV